MERIYKFAVGFIGVVCLALMTVLLISGWFWTCYAKDMASQEVMTRTDNLILNLAGTAGMMLVAAGIFHWVKGNPKRRNRILLFVVLGWYLLIGAMLVLFGRTVPAADAASVFLAAQELASGNTNVIQGVESYLSYYPHQMGLVAYFELAIRLWNLLPFHALAYHAIKCVNILWACIHIYFQFRTVQVVFHRDRADTIYLLIMLFHFPFLMYTSFVYGEVPSIALFSIGLWELVRLLSLLAEERDGVSETHGGKLRRLAGPVLVSTAAFAGSVALRKNSLILMIAVTAVVLLEGLRRKRPLLFGMAVLYAVVSLTVLPFIVKVYEYRADNELLSGVTPLSYIAMGMQEASRADGWYNGFNIDTYMKAGADRELADQISREAIRERLSYFRQHPGYTAAFYSEKFLSQWADGTYASRQATLANFGGRSEPLNQLYEGRYSGIFIELCNILQNVVYLGAFGFCLVSLKKKKEGTTGPGLPVYICLIGVFGGFLFHMIWEANSRYILPYGLLLVPYAAYGICVMEDNLEKKIG